MSRPPRISAEQRAAILERIVSAGDDAAASAVLDRLWAILEGDMQDRITTLIHAAKGTVQAKGGNLGGLERAVDALAGQEVAATSTKQLREGPFRGRR